MTVDGDAPDRGDPPAESDAETSNETGGSQFALGAGIAGAAVVLFLLLRILAVAHWNWYTAGDIADSMNFSDAVNVVLGTLFAEPLLTAVAVMILLPLAVVDLIWVILNRGSGLVGRVLLVAFLATAIVALTSTIRVWWLPFGALLFGSALALMRILWKHGRRRQVILGLLRATTGLTVLAALLFALLVDTPWTLRERITTDAGIIDGYVLETPSGYLKVLTEDSRQVEILISGDIKSRTIVD